MIAPFLDIDRDGRPEKKLQSRGRTRPKIPVPLGFGRVLLIGAVIDVGTGTSSSDFTQFNTYSTAPPIGPDAVGQRTNETINFSFREGGLGPARGQLSGFHSNWVLAGHTCARSHIPWAHSAQMEPDGLDT